MIDASNEENYNAPASDEEGNSEPKAPLRLASAPQISSDFELNQKNW